MYFTIRDLPLEGAHSTWQANMVTGLLAMESKARGWTPLNGMDIRWLEPTGRVRYGGSTAVLGFGRVQVTSRPRLIRLAEEGANAVGVILKNVWVWSVFGHLVVEITAVTDDPKAFLATYHQTFQKMTAGINNGGQNGSPLAEGTYVLVRDRSSGRWVAISAYASRLYSVVGGTNPVFK